jgi:hypothetical protein
MSARSSNVLWKETTAIRKEVSADGQIPHTVPGWRRDNWKLASVALGFDTRTRAKHNKKNTRPLYILYV